MDRIHDWLVRKFKGYANWHTWTAHRWLHLFVFICFLAIVIALLVTVLSESLPIMDETGTPSAAVTSSSDIEVTGTLTVLHVDDFEHQQGELIYELDVDDVTNSGKTKKYNLHFKKDLPNVQTGTKVKVKGKLSKGVLDVAALGDSSFQVLATAETPTIGVQNTIAILVNFTDDTSQPYTPAQVAGLLFTDTNSANNYYKENSFNQTSFAGIAVGWYTLPYQGRVSCDYNAWATAADNAAKAAGVNLSSFARKIYVLPSSVQCSWAGLGTVGGFPSRAWIGGDFLTLQSVYYHELGHNLGAQHSGALLCGTLSIDIYSQCSSGEYYDTVGPMGYANDSAPPQFNAPHKARFKWIPTSRVQQVTSNGTYSIAPIESSTTPGYQALVINKPDTGEKYYLEYRQPIGYDSALTYMTNGAWIHVDNNGRTMAIDVTPSKSPERTLSDGLTFIDHLNHIAIKQISHNSSGVTVQVDLNSPLLPCLQRAPAIAIMPSSQTGKPGIKLSYNVTVTNNDTPACTNSSTFNLVAIAPSGFGKSFSANSVTLAPTSSKTVTLSITSPSSAPEAGYVFTAIATDKANGARVGSSTATYNTFSDITPPSVQIISPVSGSSFSGNNMTITANATDNVGVVKVQILVNGNVKANLTTAPYTYVWDTSSVDRGIKKISAKVYDAAGNMSTTQIDVYFGGLTI